MLAVRSLLRRSALLSVRPFSVHFSQIDDMKNKGKGDEETYFTRKDRELLKKMLEKVDEHTLAPEELKEAEERHRATLLKISRSHSLRLTDSVVEDLLKWRRGEL
jgi:hypothetical protein